MHGYVQNSPLKYKREHSPPTLPILPDTDSSNLLKNSAEVIMVVDTNGQPNLIGGQVTEPQQILCFSDSHSSAC